MLLRIASTHIMISSFCTPFDPAFLTSCNLVEDPCILLQTTCCAKRHSSHQTVVMANQSLQLRTVILSNCVDLSYRCKYLYVVDPISLSVPFCYKSCFKAFNTTVCLVLHSINLMTPDWLLSWWTPHEFPCLILL